MPFLQVIFFIFVTDRNLNFFVTVQLTTILPILYDKKELYSRMIYSRMMKIIYLKLFRK